MLSTSRIIRACKNGLKRIDHAIQTTEFENPFYECGEPLEGRIIAASLLVAGTIGGAYYAHNKKSANVADTKPEDTNNYIPKKR